MSFLRQAEKPSVDYCQALEECIREAFMALYNKNKGALKRLHRVGIASETNKVITRKLKRREWRYGGHPDDTTIYRRLNEMANKADFLVFVEPKGCGWYRLSDSLFKVGKTMKVLGTDFYWNTIVEKDGVIYRLVFDSFTKRTRWEKIK